MWGEVRDVCSCIYVDLPPSPAEQRGGVPSAFYQYFVQKVLPKLREIPEEPQNELLRLLTSLVTFDLPEDVRHGSLEPVYTGLTVSRTHSRESHVLVSCLPPPCAPPPQSLLPEPTEGEEPRDENLQFSLVECLLFVLHSLVQKVGRGGGSPFCLQPHSLLPPPLCTCRRWPP